MRRSSVLRAERSLPVHEVCLDGEGAWSRAARTSARKV